MPHIDMMKPVMTGSVMPESQTRRTKRVNSKSTRVLNQTTVPGPKKLPQKRRSKPRIDYDDDCDCRMPIYDG